MKKLLMVLFLAATVFTPLFASDYQPEYSAAGFFEAEGTPRKVYDFNRGWKFIKSDVSGAHRVKFDDSEWESVALPHGLELLPLNASGGVNYQGPAWYRKIFELPAGIDGKELFIHFEAIMGRSLIYINGKKVTEHLGGYLPIHLNVTELVKAGEENLIAVFTDNSDDKDFPPGKSQRTLDFSYFGGIYRDSWLIATEPVFVTDANASGKVAGGGLFIRYDEWDESGSTAVVAVEVANRSDAAKNLTVEALMIKPDGSRLTPVVQTLAVQPQSESSSVHSIRLDRSALWTPDSPLLHQLIVSVKEDGRVLDSVRIKTGQRKIEFRGKEGFFLNGKAYKDKLIGGNRHQDYAYIGNALPNSGQWRDAKLMRDAGMRIVRSAHYPMDPAFMNACDELGLFVIVATPGWQFWNPKKKFEKLVLEDIRNMVRRDRNHASVILWEPILNETHYPKSFAQEAYDAVHEEYPYQGCYTACDDFARGEEIFDVVYAHPKNSELHREKLANNEKTRKKLARNYRKDKRPIFNREWGDNVDDWSSHNSPSRVHIGWGERPQLVQMLNYSLPHYAYSTLHTQYLTPPQHFGGTMWHTFDHNRGYHPDPFWGGILDAFRQPKYSYFLFKSQMELDVKIPNVESGPFIKVLHEMSPFSDEDIWVVSNCDEVRLTLFGKKIGTLPTVDSEIQMPHKPVVFKGIYNFMDQKQLFRSGKKLSAYILAEGLIDGKVVVSEKKFPATRLEKVQLKVDYAGTVFVGDGSDIVPVVATLCDRNGNIRRWSDELVRFTVSGPAEIIANGEIGANPVKAEWGQAVALIRSTGGTGKVTVFAEVLLPGENEPSGAVVEIHPVAAVNEQVFLASQESGSAAASNDAASISAEAEIRIRQLEIENSQLRNEVNQFRLKEVEQQQSEFESLPQN